MTARSRIRHWVNRAAAPLGVHVTSTRMAERQFRESQLGHLLPALRHFGIELVIDVGANVGQFAAELLQHGYDGRIVSVEPLPDAHARLAQAAAGHPRWSVHPAAALGAEAGTVTMQVAGNSVSSSVLAMRAEHLQAAPESAPTGTVQVPQTTLDAAFAAAVAGAATLIKIDTQGYERQVLEGGPRCVQQARLVLLELSTVPLYEGQWLWQEAMAWLQDRGFELWFLHPDFSDAASGRVLQYNGLFARR